MPTVIMMLITIVFPIMLLVMIVLNIITTNKNTNAIKLLDLHCMKKRNKIREDTNEELSKLFDLCADLSTRIFEIGEKVKNTDRNRPV